MAQSKKHFLVLDGLRGAAAIVVLIFHLRFGLPNIFVPFHGYLAVDFFFCLSGFVVAFAYEDRLKGGLTFPRYWLLRVARLYPLIIVGALLGFLAVGAAALLNGDQARILSSLAALPFALSALPAPPQLAEAPFELNDPSWSLFFELVASLAFGLWIFRMRMAALAVTTTLFCVLMIALVVMQGSAAFGWTYSTLILGFARVMAPFLVGVMLKRMLGVFESLRRPFFSVFSLVLLLAILWAPQLPRSLNVPFEIFAIFVGFPLVVIMGVGGTLSERSVPLVKFSGYLSYPLYITHFPLKNILLFVLGKFHLQPIFVVMIVALFCIGAAIFVGKLVDEPVRKRILTAFNVK